MGDRGLVTLRKGYRKRVWHLYKRLSCSWWSQLRATTIFTLHALFLSEHYRFIQWRLLTVRSVQLFSSQDKPPVSSSGFQFDSGAGTQTSAGRSLFSGGGIASLLGQPPSLLSASTFGGSSLLAPALGTYGAALQSARRSLIAKNRSGPYRGSRLRSGSSGRSTHGEVDFTADVQLRGDSPPNGKEKRKQKRDKFQPYWLALRRCSRSLTLFPFWRRASLSAVSVGSHVATVVLAAEVGDLRCYKRYLKNWRRFEAQPFDFL